MERLRATLEAELQEKEDEHRKHIDKMAAEFERKQKEMEVHLVQNEL